MSRITSLVLFSTAMLSGRPLQAQEPRPEGSVTEVQSPEAEPEGYGARGALIGAAGGIAAGLVIAALADYPLEEGGAVGVLFLGGGLGAIFGQKIGSSLGRPWGEPGGLQVSPSFAWARTSDEGVETAFADAGMPTANEHHSIVPAITVTYGIGWLVDIGVEASGIPARFFRGNDGTVALGEEVNGHSVGLVLNLSRGPAAHRRFSWSVGGGLDRYSWSAGNWFDPVSLDSGYPEEQPNRSSRTTGTTSGWQLRGGLEYAIVHDVSLALGGAGRWAGSVDLPAIGLLHPDPSLNRSLEGHSVDLSSFRISVGLKLRY